jgi:GNAT superfamily N-acetyltransferase
MPLRADWASVRDLDALDNLWAGHMGTSRARIMERFDHGNRCFAVWDGDTVLAGTWCDFETLSHAPELRALAPGEVYLFDAYVSPAARGRNLAPIMRAACYDACRALGRTTMLSFTDYFNESSHRFKAKLGARKLALRIQVTLFRRWSKTFTLRRYA